ncbi:MAG: sodium-dependent transporter [Ruminiclostridium sp.]|nr:sodium-dependent transporter [Ruminiclostridium sp.]
MENGNVKREGFSSGMAVFFATLGSAVGLGNIWKFPYLTGKYGGGAFLLIYLLCIVFVGLPVMVSEFYIGRSTGKNAIGAFTRLKGPKSRWKYIGSAGILSTYLIMFFYSCVAGWVYSYAFKAVLGSFTGITAKTAESKFTGAIIGPLPPIIWQIVVMAVVSAILIAGVKKGIERITRILMPVLFVLIIVCDIRALTLPGAFEGLKFLFHMDFSQLTGVAILTALGLAFFKLSLGMGAMITYGSYFTKDNNMIGTSIRVALSDTLVSLLAGLAIFPAVFSFDMEPGAGPGLLFMTIPLVFSQIPFGSVLLVAFFVLTSIAATCAMISLVEVPVAYFTEEKGIPRTKSVVLNAAIIVAMGSLAALSADGKSILGGIRIFGKTFFDLFDFTSSNILLPLAGLLIAVFTGFFVKKDDVRTELTNQGKIKTGAIIDVYYFIIRYLTPALLLIVFLYYTGLTKILFNL